LGIGGWGGGVLRIKERGTAGEGRGGKKRIRAGVKGGEGSCPVCEKKSQEVGFKRPLKGGKKRRENRIDSTSPRTVIYGVASRQQH